MASTGHAAFTVFNRSVVVRVDPDPLTRATTWIALALTPAGLLLKWAVSGDTALAYSLWPSRVILAASVGLGALLALSLARGTARAVMFIDNEPVDALRWSTSPARRLDVKLDGHAIEAEIDTSGDREIKLFVDGNLLRSVPVV
jgi:hypothetical protein